MHYSHTDVMKKQDSLPITPCRRESTSTGAPSFHEDLTSHTKLTLVQDRRESLQLEELVVKTRRSSSIKSFNSWHSSLGSSLSTAFSSMRSILLVADPDDDDCDCTFPRLMRKNTRERRRDEPVECSNPPKLPGRQSSWRQASWKSSLHSDSHRSPASSPWTRGRRSSGSREGNKDTMPLRPWRRGSQATTSTRSSLLHREPSQIERIAEVEFEHDSSNFLALHSSNDDDEQVHNNVPFDDPPPQMRSSTTTFKASNVSRDRELCMPVRMESIHTMTSQCVNSASAEEEDEVAAGAVDLPSLIARESAATVKAGTITCRDQEVSVPTRCESAHTTQTCLLQMPYNGQ